MALVLNAHRVKLLLQSLTPGIGAVQQPRAGRVSGDEVADE
jgi:hypothetical protein